MTSLRAKFLLSLTLISALLTSAVLLVVQYRVRIHVRDEIVQALRDSVVTFQNLQQQRDATLGRQTALIAVLPPLKAVMTSEDPATIEDASTTFWELAGSQIFALADRSGRLVALHSSSSGFTSEHAQAMLRDSLRRGEAHDWWFGGGHLLQVFLEPIYSGAAEADRLIGILAVGYEVDAKVAEDVTRAATSDVAFGYNRQLVIDTIAPTLRTALAQHVSQLGDSAGRIDDIRLADERFLATSLRLSSGSAPIVTLTFLKSFDQATAFVRNLDRWIAVIGLLAVAAGGVLVFVVSTTFTRPLEHLVSGVRALESGDFDYPLDKSGSDEVATLTGAFERMRTTLRDTQRQLVEAEQLATIGRMASTISHDLRHPLTAILAYAEFLSERPLTEEQRKDFFSEIRIAVNRMLDEINSLLGFSKEAASPEPALTHLEAIIDRAIKAVKALPEFESVNIGLVHGGDCVAWLDPAKFERVLLNLLFNAAQAVSPTSGTIQIRCDSVSGGTEVRVSDNGPGIPPQIAGSLFRPFVSYGKEKGIGLGLTVVQSIMRQHGGDVVVERTGTDGTTFRLFFPAPK